MNYFCIETQWSLSGIQLIRSDFKAFLKLDVYGTAGLRSITFRISFYNLNPRILTSPRWVVVIVVYD